eukprot:scaffold3405_cov167-Amphora_coffeaeformis.AAC.7
MHCQNIVNSSRKRSRKMLLLAATAALLIPGAGALSSRAATRSAPRTVAPQAPVYQPSVEKKPSAWYGAIQEDEDDELFEDNNSLVQALKELQKSTGSDVLQSDLQRQIDQVTDNPAAFLDEHIKDASELEKLAMRSITEQLPQAAVQALAKKRNDMQFSKQRVTPEQEILLARTIQKGAALQTLKQEAEEKQGGNLSRQEWADLASLSTKELRRQISQYRQAKQILVTANLGLVHAVVNQQYNQYAKSGVSKEELIQEGSLGLLRAAELFDPNRGLRFSTYAVVWIKGVLQNTHVPELVRLPQREKTKWNKICKAQRDLEAEGRQGTVEEIASLAGLSVADVMSTKRSMQQTKSVWSLDFESRTQTRSGADTSTLEYLQNNKAMQDELEGDLRERTQLQADVIAAMARNLDPREARLVRLRYGLSDGVIRSIAECADAMGLSRTRVQQLNQRCLQKLREAAEAKSLQEYLLTIA